MTSDGTMHEFSDFDFTNHQNLEVLAKHETDKKKSSEEPPPHVNLMKKMAIADYEPASDSGNMRFYPNGRLIKSLMEQFVTERVREYGGYEVETPIMYDSHHPSLESYFNRFPARQYSIDSEGKQLFLRFAACFGQFLMAADFQMSYKNLPYKLYELTSFKCHTRIYHTNYTN
jgi:threonyl-tRNA synthetase